MVNNIVAIIYKSCEDLQSLRVHYLNYQQHIIPKKGQHVKLIQKDFKTVQQNSFILLTKLKINLAESAKKNQHRYLLLFYTYHYHLIFSIYYSLDNLMLVFINYIICKSAID